MPIKMAKTRVSSTPNSKQHEQQERVVGRRAMTPRRMLGAFLVIQVVMLVLYWLMASHNHDGLNARPRMAAGNFFGIGTTGNTDGGPPSVEHGGDRSEVLVFAGGNGHDGWGASPRAAGAESDAAASDLFDKLRLAAAEVKRLRLEVDALHGLLGNCTATCRRGSGGGGGGGGGGRGAGAIGGSDPVVLSSRIAPGGGSLTYVNVSALESHARVWRAPEGGGVFLRVATFNTWNINEPWGVRRREIGRTFPKLGIDVLALQELRVDPTNNQSQLVELQVRKVVSVVVCVVCRVCRCSGWLVNRFGVCANCHQFTSFPFHQPDAPRRTWDTTTRPMRWCCQTKRWGARRGSGSSPDFRS